MPRNRIELGVFSDFCFVLFLMWRLTWLFYKLLSLRLNLLLVRCNCPEEHKFSFNS